MLSLSHVHAVARALTTNARCDADEGRSVLCAHSSDLPAVVMIGLAFSKGT